MNESINDKLNKGPVDVWSTRERLALASAVMRNGNQNWVSVSRTLRPFLDTGRPSDWFSQINCARQYQEMLEKAGTARRKRGDRDYSDTPGDVIVRKLITERIEELKANIGDLAEKYKHFKKELELVKSGQMDERMKEMWQRLQAEKAADIEERKLADERIRDQMSKVFSPKDNATSDQVSEVISSVQDSYDDVEQEQTTLADSISLNDDHLSQSTTSSHVTENNQLLSNDLQVTDVSDNLSEAEIKQEQPNSGGGGDPTVVHSVSQDLQVLETGEESLDQELKPEIKVEVKSELEDADVSTVKEEEVASEQGEERDDVQEDDKEHNNDESVVSEKQEFVDDEVTIETTDVDDIVISTEEIIEGIADNGGVKNFTENVEEQEVCNAGSDNKGVKEEAANEDDDTKEENNEEITTEETLEKTAVDAEKEPSATDFDTLIEANIEEPKTHDSVDTEPSIVVETNAVIPVKVEEDYVEPASVTSSTTDTTTKIHQQTKSSSKSKKKESKRKFTYSKNPRTSAVKEEGKESEVSSKAGTSDDEEAKNLDESAKASTSFLRSKLDISESVPNSPASVCNSDTEDERAHKAWKKSIMLVWRAISNHKFANIFMHPVTEDIAPGYPIVIFKPMDLNTIRKNIDIGNIRTTREFQRDMMLMFTNALMYNHSSHDVHKMARVMYQDAMAQIEQFVSTQMMMRSEPKLLRTLRRSDAGISDKEEEIRKRKASEADSSTPTTTKKRRH